MNLESWCRCQHHIFSFRGLKANNIRPPQRPQYKSKIRVTVQSNVHDSQPLSSKSTGLMWPHWPYITVGGSKRQLKVLWVRIEKNTVTTNYLYMCLNTKRTGWINVLLPVLKLVQRCMIHYQFLIMIPCIIIYPNAV